MCSVAGQVRSIVTKFSAVGKHNGEGAMIVYGARVFQQEWFGLKKHHETISCGVERVILPTPCQHKEYSLNYSHEKNYAAVFFLAFASSVKEFRSDGQLLELRQAPP